MTTQSPDATEQRHEPISFRNWLVFQIEVERNAPTGLTAAQRLADVLDRFDAALPSNATTNASLVEALELYGVHLGSCEVEHTLAKDLLSARCTCGLRSVLATLRASNPDEEGK